MTRKSKKVTASRSRPRHTTPATPRAPDKKVRLKLNVKKDHDAVDGDSGTSTPLPLPPSSPVAAARAVTPMRKPTVVRRPRTGQRRNSSLAERDMTASDFERWEEEHIERERQFQAPALNRFRPVSLLSFPLHVDLDANTNVDVDAATRTQHTGEMLDRQMDQAVQPRCCASCGVPEDHLSVHDHHRQFPVTQEQRRTHDVHGGGGVNTIAVTSPWRHLNLYPTRHINQDTQSVTDLVITRTGSLPQTAEFWYDMAVAELAKGTDDVDLKMLCLNLIRWRQENEIEGWMLRDMLWGMQRNRQKQRIEIHEIRGGIIHEHVDAIWDNILIDVVKRGKSWRKTRRWREEEREKAAGWAVWEAKLRSESQGEFEVDSGNGGWILRAPGSHGAVRRVLMLGYRRSQVRMAFEDNVLRSGQCCADEVVGESSAGCARTNTSWSRHKVAVEDDLKRSSASDMVETEQIDAGCGTHMEVDD